MLETVSGALATVTTAIEMIKVLSAAKGAMADAATKMKLAELISTLADAKVDIAAVTDSVLAKDEEIRDLKGKLELKETLVFDRGVYWARSRDGQDGPFCQKCWDYNEKLVRLQKGQHQRWMCFQCQITYGMYE